MEVPYDEIHELLTAYYHLIIKPKYKLVIFLSFLEYLENLKNYELLDYASFFVHRTLLEYEKGFVKS